MLDFLIPKKYKNKPFTGDTMIVEFDHLDYLILFIIALGDNLNGILFFQYYFIVLSGNFNQHQIHIIIH